MSDEKQAMNTPVAIIREEIQRQGVLSFSRFMELALYCPETGYYETEKNNVGRRGDFYTSVSVGSLFGELLAFQFAEWLEQLPVADCRLPIVEAGAHDGKLAKDILSWLQIHRAKLFERIEYVIIEPSLRRQQWQKETLTEFKPKIFWVERIGDLENRQSFSGIIFSNELLDAFPVHRFGWDANEKKWFEWGVALDGDNFIWKQIQDSALHTLPFEFPYSLLAVLPDHYIIEISSVAENWWRDAAKVLQHGWLMTLDYGLTTEEMFSPARANGTARAYFQHRVSDNLLANAAEQDITAHVNFSAIRKIGEDAGLITEFFNSQSKFLTEILAKAAKSNSLGEWNSSRTRQFQTLTHPEHLGRAFRVLVQSR